LNSCGFSPLADRSVCVRGWQTRVRDACFTSYTYTRLEASGLQSFQNTHNTFEEASVNLSFHEKQGASIG